MKTTIVCIILTSILAFMSANNSFAQDAESKIKVFDESNFDLSIKSGLVFVDFYADWCRPCKMMQPVLEEFAKDQSGKIVVAKVNTEINKKLSQRFSITGIPCMILFKDGKEIKRVVGFRDKAGLEAELANYLK